MAECASACKVSALMRPNLYMSKILTLLVLCMSIVTAEIGLTVQSDIQAINGQPVRLVDSHLTIGGEGPIFQGTYDDGSLVLSDRVVSQEAVGSGIGLSSDGLLIVTFDSATTFYDRDGWLEYNGQGIFALKKNEDYYDIYANNPDLADSSPMMLQFAALIYPNGTHHDPSLSTHEFGSYIVLGDNLV